MLPCTRTVSYLLGLIFQPAQSKQSMAEDSLHLHTLQHLHVVSNIYTLNNICILGAIPKAARVV